MGQQDRDPTERSSFSTLNELPYFPDAFSGFDADFNLSGLPLVPTLDHTSRAPEETPLSQSTEGEDNQSRQSAILNLLAQLAPSNSKQQPEPSTANQIPAMQADHVGANAAIPAPSSDKAAEQETASQYAMPVPDAFAEQTFPLTDENLTNFNVAVPSDAELALLPFEPFPASMGAPETQMPQQADVSSNIYIHFPSVTFTCRVMRESGDFPFQREAN